MYAEEIPRLTMTPHHTTPTTTHAEVGVVGAAGGIGQPLSLLLKMSPNVGDLVLCDMVGAPGVAADCGHVNTSGTVVGANGPESMLEALKGCDAVVIPAGVPRKPGMSRDDLFNTNAGIVASIAETVAKACPNAFICVISNPVNSTVPIVAEVLKKAGCYDEKKLFGVTTLDVVRANKFVGDAVGADPRTSNVVVCGGHAGTTIMPILSGVEGASFSADDEAALTKRIQFGGDEVVQAKDGSGSATLSMAYAAAHFVDRLLKAAGGAKEEIIECAYVQSPVAEKDGCAFFSTPVVLGPKGVEKILPMPAMNAAEEANYAKAIGDLKGQIQKGVEFVNK